MNFDKVFYKTLFKNLFSDPCKVRFWDGEVENYGEGEIKFEIIFNLSSTSYVSNSFKIISKDSLMSFIIFLLSVLRCK